MLRELIVSFRDRYKRQPGSTNMISVTAHPDGDEGDFIYTISLYGKGEQGFADAEMSLNELKSLRDKLNEMIGD